MSDTTKTLVNFRIFQAYLKPFDDACRLSGLTRTQVLNRMIRDFTATAAATIPNRIAEERRFGKTLKAAVERAIDRKRALTPATGGSAFKSQERRKFSEFLAADPILVKRR